MSLIVETSRAELRRIRHKRIRKHITGTAERPRLCVFRSSRHIYAQIIDDENGHTLVCASTLEKELRDQIKGLRKTEQAAAIGKLIAQRALEKGIKSVVFDRGGYKYHGRVKALADASREAGLEF
ncbi:50S ribosomal protein L18 [Coprothermobacter proteolyticus]|uniref:Large ribosomal subunit protein uL18 n=1 Tax=Coprothermobacter proteolyticus (strain ATCC 35245 / DSM 5265 / OCM 4 / BT) TaxID=309798 RepID=B5Y971_COPPD|nr:50S ribosomal protein L18 [Coprothermobacter proteolyticus]MBP8983370.1 50S ribosomal protein L18 [Coprothermobacter sp.]NLT83719.1 50S ribosomal protein L18 [Coprothermobacter proteolyticus]